MTADEAPERPLAETAASTANSATAGDRSEVPSVAPANDPRATSDEHKEGGKEEQDASTGGAGPPSQKPPAPPDTPPGAPGSKLVGGLTDIALKVAGAVATTAGFLTLVAGTGAAITWARFDAAQLPADQAISVIPKEDLYAVGGIALAVFTVLGLVAVAGVYAIDPQGKPTDEMRRGLSVLVTAEVIVAIVLSEENGAAAWAGGAIAATLGVLGVLFMSLLPARPPSAGASEGNWQKFRRSLGGVFARHQKVPPTKQAIKEAKEMKDLGYGDGNPPETYRRRLTPLAIGLAGLAAISNFLLFLVLFEEEFVAISVLAASALAAICLGVARASGRKFWPYGLAIFFSVALFGAVLNVLRLAESPEANPTALLRAGDSGPSGVIGLLVARADDRYWLGTVTIACKEAGTNTVPTKDGEKGSGRIFSIPRTEVVDDEIGALSSLEAAGWRAPQLLRELVKRQPPGGSASRSADLTKDANQKTSRRAKGASKGNPAVAPTPAVEVPCTCVSPQLDRLRPAVATGGDSIQLTGSGFGKPGRVTLKEHELKIRTWRDRTITAQLPRDARSGEVVVDCGRKSEPRPLTIRGNA